MFSKSTRRPPSRRFWALGATALAVAIAGVAPINATASQVPTAGGEAKVVDNSPLTGAARERALRQEAVTDVAARIQAINDYLAEPRLTGMSASPVTLTVDVWWVGQPPLDLIALANQTGNVTVRVHPGFHTDAAIEAAAGRFLSTALAAKTASLGFDVISVTRELDGSGLRVGVMVTGAAGVAGSPAPAAITSAVKALPSLIPVTAVIHATQPVATIGRQADVPFWTGGARIINRANGEYCSSGYGVRTGGGASRMASARHCVYGGVGQFVTPQNAEWTQGAATISLSPDSEQLDSLIANTTEFPSPTVYTGAYNSTTVRTVKGEAVNQPTNQVCSSGATSGQHCALILKTKTTIRICYTADCSASFYAKVYPADNPNVGLAVAGGDSGGPVFVERPDGGVTIRGIVTAGDNPVACPAGSVPDNLNPPCYHTLYFVAGTDLDAYWNITAMTG